MKAFDEIAGEWDEYRSKPSSCLKLLLPLVKPRDVVLDAGCGNGRNLVELAKRCALAYGLDSSTKMLEAAGEKTKNFDNVILLNASITAIPLPAKSIDSVLCLAVLHHLQTEREKLLALAEFRRVLKPKGEVFITVWNKRQKKFAGLKGSDAQIKWRKKDGNVVERYYHFFSKNELKELGEKTRFAMKEVFYEKNGEKATEEGAANLCAVLEKA